MKTVQQGGQKDKSRESQSQTRMVFLRLPVSIHYALKRIALDLEEKTGKQVTLQSLLSLAVADYVERNGGRVAS